MKENEAAYVVGAEQYSAYKGYGKNFEFKANVNDEITLDAY